MAAGKRLICDSADLVDGGRGFRFNVDLGCRQAEAFAIRFVGTVRAYLNECGHVPAQLDWLPGEFFDESKLYLVCSVHGALYAPDSGACLGGRCQGRGLQPLPVCEMNNRVYLKEEQGHG